MSEKRMIDSQTLALGEILRKPFVYMVPFYQRDFAWTEEEVQALWDDLTNALIDRGADDYFLGAIVISPSSRDKAKEIVDGQQRLATVSMLFSAIAKAWIGIGDEDRARGVQRDYLGTEDRRTKTILPKIKLNETNDSAFHSVVLDRSTPTATTLKTWKQSNTRILRAFQLIDKELTKWLNGLSDKESALLDLEEFIANQFSMIVIEVGNDADAFIIFETLNDRGLDLAVSDLVKNYLFAQAGTHIEWFKQGWLEVTTLVGTGALTQFLRHYWLSTKGLVRERDLYRELRKNIKNSTRARQFLDELKSAAIIYAALSNPEHAYWADLPQQSEAYLEALLTFKVTQFRPVALAALQMLSPNKAAKVLHLLEVISFRYTVVSALGTGNLEKIYSDCAIAIREGRVKTPKAIFNLLKMAYVDDATLRKAFVSKRFTKSSIARYVLAGINNSLESTPEKEVSISTRKITLEHILPKNPSASWRKAYADQEEFDSILYNIGNLTLLERGKNKGLGNAAFKKKQSDAYSTSLLPINDSVRSELAWNTKTIRARAKSFAKEAAKIWRIDY